MEKWEENFKKIMEADKNSSRLIFEEDSQMLEFLLNCEKVYGKTTTKHIEDYTNNEFEGNVDEDRWYRFARHLMESGHVFK